MNRYDVNDKCITIYDSYLVHDDKEKVEVLTEICLNVEGLELCRNFSSMMTEWKAHNILYKLRVQRKRTKDVDIEFRQSKCIALLYKIICLLFKE